MAQHREQPPQSQPEPFPVGAEIVLDFKDGYIDPRKFTIQGYSENQAEVTFSSGMDDKPIVTHIWLESLRKLGQYAKGTES